MAKTYLALKAPLRAPPYRNRQRDGETKDRRGRTPEQRACPETNPLP
ncbi:hypothetical protein CBH50_005225 [Salmonella enterica subsp. diarizonae serovar 60:r:e,n,x,z15]|nr:hypothetical protein [Salmonella enterica subsp. diarizonae serovar 60:r:e,n,x,z15]